MISWIITIGLVCIITCVIFCRPYLGIVLIVISIPFEGSIFLEGVSIYPLEVILGISVLIYIYKSIVGRNNYPGNMKLVYCCIPFVLCIMLSAVKSIELPLTVKEIVRWLELFLIYYLTINLINDYKKMRIILYSMFLTVAIVSIWGIINYDNGLWFAYKIHRAFSFFDNPNPLAGYVNLIIPVLFGALMISVSSLERRILVVITILSIAALYFTYSRVAWLSLVLVMVFLFFRERPKKRVLLFLAIFSLILAFTFLIPDIRDYFKDRSNLQNLHYTLDHRASCYTVGYNLLKNDSVFGIGIGNFPLLVKKYIYSDPLLIKRFVYYDNSIMLTHLHSLYLQLFVETGLIGLCAFIFWLVCIIKYLVRNLKVIEKSRNYGLFVGLMGGVIVYLLNNLTDVLVVHGIHLQWGIILGLAVVLTQFRESETCPKMV